MPQTLPTLARELLTTLLDRAERPDRKTVTRVTLDAARHAVYFERFEVQQAVNQAMTDLAERGLLRLHWVKGQAHLLDKVDLVPEHAAELYALLGRQPRADQAAALRGLLLAQSAPAGWAADFIHWALAQVEAHKSPVPLKLGEAGHNRDLLRALAALAQLNEPTLERTLSVQLFGDSKRLEELRSEIVGILSRFSPQAEPFADDDRALLAAHWLERVPEYIALAGPLQLRVSGQLCDCAPFAPSLALPAPLIRQAEIAGCSATALLTVENATTFVDVCRQRPVDLLVIYTAGFASPTLTQFLRRFHAAMPGCTVWHWGDLDAGGFRILRHLRKSVPLQALAANPALLDHHRPHLKPLTDNDRQSLAALRPDPVLADCRALIDQMLTENLKLEQEVLVFSEVWPGPIA